MTTKQTKKKVSQPNKPKFQPCSEKQRLVLTENEVDILLTGGKQTLPPV